MTTVKQLIGTIQKDVFSVTAGATVLEALRLIMTKHIGAVSVLDDAGHLAGVFSERDHVRRVTLESRDPASTLVKDVMTAPVITVTPEDSVDHCMVLMTQRHVRHLPVVSEERLIGMISMRDVVRHVLSDKDHAIEELEHYIVAG